METRKQLFVRYLVFGLALSLVFLLPRIGMAGGKSKGEIADPDVSEAVEQEIAEGAQDMRQGTDEAVQETQEAGREVMRETEEAARETAEGVEAATAEAAEETAEFMDDVEQVIDRSARSLEEVIRRANRIPKELIDNSAAVAVFPDVTKAGFIVGGRYGQGVLMLNQKNGWNGPIFISLLGASVGAQLGIEQTDLFMIFTEKEALDGLRDGELTLGAETSVAAGTWGAKAGATTQADVLAYKQTEGLFAGVSLSGAVIDVDEDMNEEYFKKDDASRSYYGTDVVLSGDKEIPKTQKTEKLVIILKDWK